MRMVDPWWSGVLGKRGQRHISTLAAICLVDHAINRPTQLGAIVGDVDIAADASCTASTRGGWSHSWVGRVPASARSTAR